MKTPLKRTEVPYLHNHFEFELETGERVQIFLKHGIPDRVVINGQQLKLFDAQNNKPPVRQESHLETLELEVVEAISRHVTRFFGYYQSIVFDENRRGYVNENHASFEQDAELEDLIREKFTPVFTIPREFISSVLTHGLNPHETWDKSSCLAGTVGRIPYNVAEENRFLAIVRYPEKLSLRERKTGPENEFQGVVAYTGNIPLEDLLIIDSKNISIVYPLVKKEATAHQKAQQRIQESCERLGVSPVSFQETMDTCYEMEFQKSIEEVLSAIKKVKGIA